MKHLLSYPYINEKFKKNEINIFGWYYIIETGEIYNFDHNQKKFLKIE
jgi:carbonic anhydrase